jgi:hypothetical protein
MEKLQAISKKKMKVVRIATRNSAIKCGLSLHMLVRIGEWDLLVQDGIHLFMAILVLAGRLYFPSHINC